MEALSGMMEKNLLFMKQIKSCQVVLSIPCWKIKKEIFGFVQKAQVFINMMELILLFIRKKKVCSATELLLLPKMTKGICGWELWVLACASLMGESLLISQSSRGWLIKMYGQCIAILLNTYGLVRTRGFRFVSCEKMDK